MIPVGTRCPIRDPGPTVITEHRHRGQAVPFPAPGAHRDHAARAYHPGIAIMPRGGTQRRRDAAALPGEVVQDGEHAVPERAELRGRLVGEQLLCQLGVVRRVVDK